MIVLAVTWRAKEGQERDVAQIFRALELESRKEPGCLMYVVHRHRTDHQRFFIYEQYRDEKALEAHRNSPHFQSFAVAKLPRVADRVDGDLFQPLASLIDVE
jgi:quinol monooxygenase YgiN